PILMPRCNFCHTPDLPEAHSGTLASIRTRHVRHPPMNELLRRNLIPLIVATALFMENLDATVLATSLPAIAKDLGANPINLKLALTTYLLALAVFIPASGWMADRFGAKNIF